MPVEYYVVADINAIGPDWRGIRVNRNCAWSMAVGKFTATQPASAADADYEPFKFFRKATKFTGLPTEKDTTAEVTCTFKLGDKTKKVKVEAKVVWAKEDGDWVGRVRINHIEIYE